MLLSVLLTFALLTSTFSQSDRVPSWDLSRFTHDGRNNPFIYPQMATITANQTVIVYHYGANGVSGQSGLSFITDRGQYVKTLTNITGNGAPCTFFYDRQAAQLPYPANFMRIVQSVDQSNQPIETIQMIIPCLIQTDTQTRSVMTNIQIDLNGNYIGTFTRPTEFSFPYQNAQVSFSKDDFESRLVIGAPISRTFNLYDYWQLIGGKTEFAGQPVVFWQGETPVIAVMVDDSMQSSPLVSQSILMLNVLNGEVVGLIDHLRYDSSQLYQSSLFQLYLNQPSSSVNQRILVRSPDRNIGAENAPSTVYMYTVNPSVLVTRPTVNPGQVSNVWLTRLGELTSQAVFPQSVVCSSTTNFRFGIRVSNEVVCFNSATKQIINRITQISQMSQAALTLGASPNITDYLIVAMAGRTVNNVNQIYLSFISPTFDQPYEAPPVGVVTTGVLIIDTTGRFIDYYDGFQFPQGVFFTRIGEMVVPDRWDSSLSVVDLTTRSIVRTVQCAGCLGGGINRGANGGYVISSTTSSPYGGQVRFYRDDWSLNSGMPSIAIQTPSLSSTSNTAPLSNPLTDSEGRVYVLANSAGGQGRATGSLRVYNQTTMELLGEHDFSNPQPRGTPGVAQFAYCSSIAMDPVDQSIVVTSNDMGQVFRTRSYIARAVSSSSSSAAPVVSSSSTAVPTSAPVPSSSPVVPSSSPVIPSSTVAPTSSARSSSSSSSSSSVVPSSSSVAVVPSSSSVPVVPSSSSVPVVPTSVSVIPSSSSVPVIPSSTAAPTSAVIPSSTPASSSTVASSAAPSSSSSVRSSSSSTASLSSSIASSTLPATSPVAATSSPSITVQSSTAVQSSSAQQSSGTQSSTGIQSSSVSQSSSIRSSSTAASSSSASVSSPASASSSAQSSTSAQSSSSASGVLTSATSSFASSSGVVSSSSVASSAAASSVVTAPASSSTGFSSIFTSLSSAATGTSVPVIVDPESSSSGATQSSSTGVVTPSSSSAGSTGAAASSATSDPSASSSSTGGLADIVDDSSSSGLTDGELAAAIVVPIVVVLAVAIAALMYFCRPTGAKPEKKTPAGVVPEADTTIDDHTVNVVEMVP